MTEIEERVLKLHRNYSPYQIARKVKLSKEEVERIITEKGGGLRKTGWKFREINEQQYPKRISQM